MASDEVLREQGVSNLLQEADALVKLRKKLVDGGFTTEEAFTLIETLVNKKKDDDDEEE